MPNRFDRYVDDGDDQGVAPASPSAPRTNRFLGLVEADEPPQKAPRPGFLRRILDPLHALGQVVSAPKRGIDYLARTGARALGIGENTPDEQLTTGKMLRQIAGFDPLSGERSEFEKTLRRAVPGYSVGELVAPKYAERLAGRGVEFAGEMATDPVTYSGLGLGGAAGRVAGGAMGLEMGRGGLAEAAVAKERFEREGFTPEVAEEALGAGLSFGMAGLGLRHGLESEPPPPRGPRVVPEDYLRGRERKPYAPPRSLAEIVEEPVADAPATLAGLNESFPEVGAEGPGVNESFPEVGKTKPQPVVERPFFGEPEEPFYVPEEGPPPVEPPAPRQPVPAEPTFFPEVPDESPTFFPEVERGGTKAERARRAALPEREPRTEEPPFAVFGRIVDGEAAPGRLADFPESARTREPAQAEPEASAAPEVAPQGRQRIGTAMPAEVPEGWSVDPSPTAGKRGRGEFVVVDSEGTVREVLPDRRSAVRRANELAAERRAPEDDQRTYIRQWMDEHPNATRDEIIAEAEAYADRKAETDETTGLLNKRGWKRILAEKSPAAHVVYIDLKKFKPVNDKIGHAAGDKALSDVASLVRKHFGDRAARQGGDEFGAVLDGLTLEEAQARTEAFREELRNKKAVYRNEATGETLEVPGFEAHIGVGLDEAAADAAANAAAERSYAAAGEQRRGASPAEPRPEPTDAGTVEQPRVEVPGVERPAEPVGAGGREDALRPAGEREGVGAAEEASELGTDPHNIDHTAAWLRGPVLAELEKGPLERGGISRMSSVQAAAQGPGDTGFQTRWGTVSRKLAFGRAFDGVKEDASTLKEIIKRGRKNPNDPAWRSLLEQIHENISDEATEHAARRAPKQGTQGKMFGGEMLQGVEKHVPEGREAEGPLFTQERDKAVKADEARQTTLLDDDAPFDVPPTTPTERAGLPAQSDFLGLPTTARIISNLAKSGFERAEPVLARAYELAKSGIKNVADFGARLVKEFGNGIKTHLEALYDWATDAIEALADKYPRAAGTLGEMLGGPEAMVSKATARPLRPIPPGARPGQPAPTAAQTRGYNTPEATTAQAFDRAVADRYADIKRMVATVRDKGGVAPRSMTADPEMAARVAGSKKAAHIAEMERKFAEPVVAIARRAGISWDDASDYVMAKHAPEANRELLRRNAAGHSGMSDTQAAQVIARARASGKLAAYEKIAQQIQKLNAWKLDIAEREGIYSPQQIAQFRQSWGDWWVPTREDAIMPDDSIFRSNLPRGFDVRRKLQARTGRGTRAMDPLAAAFVDAQNIAIAAENNHVARALVELHRNNPQLLDLAEPVAPMVPRLDAQGKVRHVKDTLSLMSDPTVIGYKENGVQKWLQFKHPNPDQAAYYAAAFKDMGRDDIGPFLKGVSKVTKTMAALSTRHNPVFSLVFNPIRDAIGAIPSITTEHGADVAAGVASRLMPGKGNRTSILREILNPGTANPEFRRYVEAGGKISNYNFADIEEMSTALKKKTEQGKLRDAADKIAKLSGALNDTMEASTRFALFQELRARGVSEAEALIASRNVSLDFDKRGMKMAEPAALYSFFNAHVQGAKRLVDLATQHPRRFGAVATGLVGLGLLQDLVNSSVAGDQDGDGINDYDQMPPWAKENNYVFGKVMLPAPPGFSFLHGIGTNVGAAWRGAISKSDAALNTALSVQQAFNPLGGEGLGKGDAAKGLALALTPTALKPPAEVALNQTQLGSPVMPDQPKFGAKKKDSELHFKSVNPIAKGVAQALERWGIADVSPETFEQLFTGYLGGAGRTASQTAKVAGHLASGELPPVRETPVLGRMFYEPHPSEQSRRYYETADEINDTAQRARELRKAGKNDDARKLESGILRARGAFDATHARLKTLHEARNRAEARGADTKMLDASIEAAMRKANKAYQDARKRAGLPVLREAR